MKLHIPIRSLLILFVVVAFALGFVQKRNDFIRSEVESLGALGIRIESKDDLYWVWIGKALIVYYLKDGKAFDPDAEIPFDLEDVELRLSNIGISPIEKLRVLTFEDEIKETAGKILQLLGTSN